MDDKEFNLLCYYFPAVTGISITKPIHFISLDISRKDQYNYILAGIGGDGG